MGTRVLTGALKELVLEDPSMRDKFDEIILAAPDIDADTFKRDIAPKILAGEGGTTLYASSGDYALMASKPFAGYPRAGDTAEGVTIAPGVVDTIDASSIRTTLSGTATTPIQIPCSGTCGISSSTTSGRTSARACLPSRPTRAATGPSRPVSRPRNRAGPSTYGSTQVA
jgi:Alpha/beta hydrolase of unknown function (DUF900)